MSDWHQVGAAEVPLRLATDPTQGLTEAEAARRLTKVGPNAITERGGRSAGRILWEQLTATMVVILLLGAAVSGALGAFKDTLAIGAIVLLYVFLGFVQDYRAERAMAALKKLAVPTVKVVREGELREISSRALVPGDLLLIETGNLISADCRLLESVNLRIQEAALTGESEPVDKHAETLTGDLPLGDRRNMVYMGTSVTAGRGRAVVVATGMRTELGKIADLMQVAGQEQTPLQHRLDQVGRILAVVGLVTAGVIFVLGLLRGDPWTHMLLTGVSVAVAIVPEGLPAVVTITLTVGAQRMLRRRALIRKLPAVETLGSVTVICSDKTGTLTENRMTVVMLDVAGHQLDLSEELRHGSPRFTTDEVVSTPSPFPLLLIGGALCNDAQLVPGSSEGKFHALGDPTEGALVVAAARLGFWKGEMEKALPRVSEIPFDSDRKRMTTVHEVSDFRATLPALNQGELAGWPYIGFTKGSVDGLLEISDRVWLSEKAEPLTPEWRRRVEFANRNMAQKGMRVLGVAVRPLSSSATDGPGKPVERELIFVGLFGLIDPPRSEVREAVATCRRAGIRPIMITGDHPLTAVHIARELGIARGNAALTGGELDRLSVQQMQSRVGEVSVYARVSPEHKLKIVQTLQENGHIVAMTGDGVNDAPALKKSDIGVAMGVAGTDVAKEASDMVLLDDNFATIVSAVEEGRTIYDNVRKFVKYSVAGNIGKVLVMLLAPFLGKPIPLLPLQLLWLNLLTDGLMGLGLGLEPAEPGIMSRPPYSPKEGVFSRGVGGHVAWVGAFIGSIALAVGAWYFYSGEPSWQTMIFTTLALSQVWQAFATRSLSDSIATVGLLSNRLLLAMAILTITLQMAVVHVGFLQDIFQTVPLRAVDLVVSVALSATVFLAIEAEKWLIRRRVA